MTAYDKCPDVKTIFQHIASSTYNQLSPTWGTNPGQMAEITLSLALFRAWQLWFFYTCTVKALPWYLLYCFYLSVLFICLTYLFVYMLFRTFLLFISSTNDHSNSWQRFCDSFLYWSNTCAKQRTHQFFLQLFVRHYTVCLLDVYE